MVLILKTLREKIEEYMTDNKVSLELSYDEFKKEVGNFFIKEIEKNDNKEELITILRNEFVYDSDESFSLFSSILLDDYLENIEIIYNNTPPLEAYEYIGNNKLEIKHSTRSYGLLFE